MCIPLDAARALTREGRARSLSPASPDDAVLDLTDPHVRLLPIETLALAVAQALQPATTEGGQRE